MTKTQARRLYNALVRHEADELRRFFDKAWRSGAFDPEKYDGAYAPMRLPRVLLKAALMEAQEQVLLVDPRTEARVAKSIYLNA